MVPLGKLSHTRHGEETYFLFLNKLTPFLASPINNRHGKWAVLPPSLEIVGHLRQILTEYHGYSVSDDGARNL